MALTRCYPNQESWWEVDRSRIAVYRVSRDYWEVIPLRGHQPGEADSFDYCQRHALLEARYSSRARAVDAVRLALSCESRQPEQASTAWERVSPGEYRSRDGAWILLRKGEEIRLIARSPQAKKAVDKDPYPEALLSMGGPRTLADCALLTDVINSRLGL